MRCGYSHMHAHTHTHTVSRHITLWLKAKLVWLSKQTPWEDNEQAARCLLSQLCCYPTGLSCCVCSCANVFKSRCVCLCVCILHSTTAQTSFGLKPRPWAHFGVSARWQTVFKTWFKWFSLEFFFLVTVFDQKLGPGVGVCLVTLRNTFKSIHGTGAHFSPHKFKS